MKKKICMQLSSGNNDQLDRVKSSKWWTAGSRIKRKKNGAKKIDSEPMHHYIFNEFLEMLRLCLNGEQNAKNV